MNKKIKLITSMCAMTVLFAFSLYLGQVINDSNAKAVSADGSDTRAIEVTGTGSVKVKPDIAVLNIGVTSNGTTTDVQADNTKAMNNVLASVKALGVDDKDIKTVSYYMNPQYDYSSDKSVNTIIGYSVSNMIEVKVRNIDKAGEVLAAAVKAGANVNNGISFTLSNVDEYYNQALTNAVLNAKSKAGALAKAIGVNIELPSKVTENTSYYSPAQYGNYNSMAKDSAGVGEVAVSQGELEITANVTVLYEY